MSKTNHFPRWLRGLFAVYLKLWGWKLRDLENLSRVKKAVIIGYPHTSNFDGLAGIPAVIVMNIPVKILVKDSLMKPRLLGAFMKMLGSIPIDRTRKANVVQQVVERFEQADSMFLLMAPEGTRKRQEYWKTGFYHIAVAANVPILMGWIRYDSKELGISAPFYPTGDIEADLEVFREFYADKGGKYMENATPFRVKPKELQTEPTKEA